MDLQECRDCSKTKIVWPRFLLSCPKKMHFKLKEDRDRWDHSIIPGFWCFPTSSERGLGATRPDHIPNIPNLEFHHWLSFPNAKLLERSTLPSSHPWPHQILGILHGCQGLAEKSKSKPPNPAIKRRINLGMGNGRAGRGWRRKRKEQSWERMRCCRDFFAEIFFSGMESLISFQNQGRD